MNWKEIKDECPKAWECLRIWHNDNCGFIDHPDVWEMGMLDEDWELRHLYDFFDDNKLYVVVQRDWDTVSECDTTEWYFDISIGVRNTENGAGVWFENRKDCETTAFQRAFNLLEEKITLF